MDILKRTSYIPIMNLSMAGLKLGYMQEESDLGHSRSAETPEKK
jgi:hypothetical protein